jgi:hypothetical protein
MIFYWLQWQFKSLPLLWSNYMENFSDQQRCFLQVYTWFSRCEGHWTTRNHDFFYLNFGKKTPPYGFLVPCPIWQKCHFGQVISTSIILTRFFWLVFLTYFFLLNHHDNNVIWAMTKNMYYLKNIFKINMRILIN